MEPKFVLVGQLDPIAVYAAIIATLVLIWDIVKWASTRARLRVRVKYDMETFNLGPRKLQGKKFVLVTVTNVGSKPTTVQMLGLGSYANWLAKLIVKRSRASVIIQPILDARMQSLPHRLDHGDEWTGIIAQNNELQDWANSEKLYAEIYHSLGKRPVRARINIPEN